MSQQVPVRGSKRSRTKRTALSKSAQMWIAGGVALALVSTIAVIANGYDARETPRAEAGVWVTRDTGQYARVNTDTGEVDIVRKVTEPSGLLQSSSSGVVFSNGNGRAWPIDASNPVDFGDAAKAAEATDEAPGEGTGNDAQTAANTSSESASGGEGASAVRMPDGTRDIVGAGRYVGVITESGAAYVGELVADSGSGAPALGAASAKREAEDLGGRLSSLRAVTPLDENEQVDTGEQTDAGGQQDATKGDAKQKKYQADAVAVSADGQIALYSSAENAVRRFDAATAEPRGAAEELPAAAKDVTKPQLALVGDKWALLDAEQGRLWRDGSDIKLDIEGVARLQASSSAQPGGALLVADTAGLWRVPQSGQVSRAVEAKGVPAQPVEVAGSMHAAWMGQSSGELWQDGEGDTTPLQFDDAVRDKGDLDPVFRSNGERAVLSETQTGMLWTLPEGTLIPLSQWTISDPPKEDRGSVVVDEVTEQIAPTAMADAFGVRAGQPAQLSVLLNDFDANKRDVLTIVPESLSETPLPEGFGSLQLMPDGQSLTAQISDKATGSASLSYRITDGTLTSETATVTLTVVDKDANSAPAWCPVEGCQREWRVPEIAPGGTLVYPILEGWVDPESDVMMLSGVEVLRPEDPVRAIVTADGKLALRHVDPNAGASDVMLRIFVRDDRGEEQQRELQLAVQPDAPAEFSGTAATVKVGEPEVLRPLQRVAGGSGSYALTSATIQGTSAFQVTPQLTTGTVEVVAAEAGTATLSVNVRDTVTGGEAAGTLRVTATADGASLALPPLRAFVRPLSDSTVEVLDAIPGASSRALSVNAVEVLDGELRADVIEHAKVRVAGATPDGAPGRIGAANVTVAEGDAVSQGRLTVFQVPETGSAGAIAVADSATVRAGSITDIRVLDNDIAPPGDRLLLNPQVTGSKTKGELAFASGNVLRYLAPSEPGTYRLSYTAYGTSTPEVSDLGAVYVTVVPKGANKDPQPRTLTARVSPGEQAEVRVPLSGVDPDGDRVRLVNVSSPEDSRVTVSMTGAKIIAAASDTAKPGQHDVEYGVRDDSGGSATGKLRVIVLPDTSKESAPIASTDQVRLAPNSAEPAVVQPLDNDIDPARGKLSIVSVEPNVAGGKKNPDYKQLAARIDLSELKKGRVSLKADKNIGSASYRYTIKSSATSSTADGLIVLQTSERVGTQAPSIDDTVLSVRDRAALSGPGVDVVTDKVRWLSGDAASLKLSLWGKNADSYRVDGNRIVGKYNPDGALVVFRLTGTDITGTEVSSYGFLMVPPLDELRLTLKAGLKPLKVDEDKSIEARVQDLVDLGSGDRAELQQGGFGVGRSQASCSAISNSTVRYSSGKEAPWSDTCLISVRLVGQKAWTTLPVPIDIVPRQPIVQLNPLSRTVAPGESETIRFSDMVTWQGGRAGDVSKLRFETSGGQASLFEVSAGDGTLKVTAKASALSGSQGVVSVSVSGLGESRAPLTLRVGEAPKDLPLGGTLKLNCNVDSECNADLLKVPGQRDPFAGKSGGGLTLASIDTKACSVGNFSRVGESGISVAWPEQRGPGGLCNVGFEVRDAQGRSGQGKIVFDASGFPAAPSSITQTAYSATSVTLTVSLGGQAYPAVTGVSVSAKDVGATNCTTEGAGGSYTCVVNGLSNGVKHSFTAVASNPRSSPASTPVEAWAYEEPGKPGVKVTPTKNADRTDQDNGELELDVTGATGTARFQVSIDGAAAETVKGPDYKNKYTLPVGSHTFKVTPVSAYDPPEGAQATGAFEEKTEVAIGAPKLDSVTLSTGNATSATVKYSPQTGDHNGEEVTYTFGVAQKGTEPTCSSALGGGPVYDSNLVHRAVYKAIVCASSEYGRTWKYSKELRLGGKVPPPSGNLKYGVKLDASQDIGKVTATYDAIPPSLSPSDGATVIQYQVGGNGPTDFALNADVVDQSIKVRQCIDPLDEVSCSAWSKALGYDTAPTTVSINVPEAPSACYSKTENPTDPEALKSLVNISAAARPYAKVQVKDVAAIDATAPLEISWGHDVSSPFKNLKPVTINVCTTP